MFEVKYSILDKMRPLIDQAKELEKQMHSKARDEKAASGLIKMAQEADVELDEDLQYELHEKLGSKAQKLTEEGGMLKSSKLLAFKEDQTLQRRRENRVEQRRNELKKKYDREIESQRLRRVSNSSFLTPEAARYLNEAVREKREKVDEEVLLAGLHETKMSKMQFKRNEKFSSKYTKRRQDRRKRKGRFG